jgi:hypothetical protein
MYASTLKSAPAPRRKFTRMTVIRAARESSHPAERGDKISRKSGKISPKLGRTLSRAEKIRFSISKKPI